MSSVCVSSDMDLQVLRRLLFLMALIPLSSGSEHDACQNYRLQFERVFSVPGDVAMLSSTLLSPFPVFNLSAVPYNVTWYRFNSTQPISNESGRVLVMEDTLWFLNVTVADDGEYVTVVSTPQQCYRQHTQLVVDQPLPQCGRPRTAGQRLTKRVTDWLPCPLKKYISKLDRYGVPSSVTWYKGCELITDGTERFIYWGTSLKIEGVESEDQGLYTCTLKFTLGGVSGSVSETIDAEVKGDYCMVPQVREGANDIIKAPLGSNFIKRCLVFVPCEGSAIPEVDVLWWVRDNPIEDTPSQRIYSTKQREVERQDSGVWLESWLMISELKEEDFHLNYTCYALSARGSPYYYFTLLPTDPELFLPVGLLLGSCMLLFILSISVYHVFKVDLVLWFRGAFAVLYTNTDSDGRLYDAYVAYPQRCAGDWTDEMEVFALQTLPQVLEKACGYRLFIAGRDCLPGEAVTESVEENLQASRRILLLYTASTFNKKYCSNNNTLLSRPSTGQTTGTEDHQSTGHTSEEQQDRGPQSDLESAPQSQCEDMCVHAQMQLECVAAMHRALLERSLKVILVELEELGPSQVKQLPESVRHLRQTQGAVCWWKTQSTTGSLCRTACTRRTEDAETELSSCVSPNCRFWKEVRYRMPVRGKRTSSPETSALLHL